MVITTCIECGSLPKYKCPTCRQPYCSVNCCKRHKESSCSAPSESEETLIKETITPYEFPTEDTVPVDKLKLLEQSTDLKKCLENPHVREILEELDKSPQPDVLIKKYMQEPIFTEFVDACLNAVQKNED